MKRHEITKPIGMSTICKDIELVCKNAKVYKCGVKPKHLIVPLSAGSGRTTLMEYMTDMYKEHGIFDFSGSLDDYIEVTVDGSSSRSISQCFSKFRADYRNEYSNIAAIHIDDMAKYLTAPQFADFLQRAKELCRTAYVVFFVSSDPTPNEEKLIVKLIEYIGANKVQRTIIEKYTLEDICILSEKTIGDHGILIEHYQMFHTALMDLVMEYNISDVKSAVEIAESVIHYADFSRFTPAVNDRSLAAMTDAWNRTTKRSESK